MARRTTIATGKVVNGRALINMCQPLKPKDEEQTITSHYAERITIKYDGERFALIAEIGNVLPRKIIILNPREAVGIAEFIFKHMR